MIDGLLAHWKISLEAHSANPLDHYTATEPRRL